MAVPTGGSGLGGAAAPTESNTKGLPQLLGLGTAGLGVLNFLLGFTAFVKIDGLEVLGGDSDSARNYFQVGTPVVALSFLLFGALLAGVALLPKQEWDGAVAVASVVGFLTLLFMAFSLDDGLSLAYGAYVVLFFALVQSAVAVAALLLKSGVVKAPVKKPAQTFGGGYGPGQNAPGHYGAAPQSPYGAPQQSWGQPQGFQGQPHPGQPQNWGAQPTGQQQGGYTSPYASQPSYGRPDQQYPRQDQQSGPYGGYGQPQPQAPQPPTANEAPTQQYRAPGASTLGTQSQGEAPESQPSQPSQPDATQAFRAGVDDKD